MRAHRAGLTLFELLVALALLLFATAVLMQLLGIRARVERSVTRDEQLIREANNLLEQLSGIPWAQLDERHVAVLVQQANQRLEEDFEVQLTSSDADLGVRQIRVWWPMSTSDAGAGSRRCLTTWRYGPASGREENEEAAP